LLLTGWWRDGVEGQDRHTRAATAPATDRGAAEAVVGAKPVAWVEPAAGIGARARRLIFPWSVGRLPRQIELVADQHGP
jgi:hypothetical protein